MEEAEIDFLYDLAEFSHSSMEWCCKESEKATEAVNDIINILLEDATRVSAVSQDTLDALNSMKDLVNALGSKESRDTAKELATALSETAAQDEEIRAFVSPIMEALQFQDRVSQNMSNFTKMIRTWIEAREEVHDNNSFSEEDKINFGERLLKCTTMNEERDLIRRHIKNLKEEEKAPEDVLFF